MVERRQSRTAVSPKRAGGNYFPDSGSVVCIPTGCAVLDCTLGGGWALGRIVNIVGDKAVGKTLLAIEACANIAKMDPKARIWYREAEAAFDEHYAEQLGLPLKRVDFGPDGLGTPWDTIEDIFEDLENQLEASKKAGNRGLYIIDSLDALTSRPALGRKVGQGSYNLEKQKILSQMLSTLARRIKATNVCVIFVSQVRDNIGFVIGEKHRRSGGKSLDFYASQILWLSHLKNLTRSVNGAKRVVAARVLAVCKKNKIVMPFRRCEFNIRFGYGVDDIESSLDWLEENKMLKHLDLTASGIDKFLVQCDKLPPEQYRERSAVVREAVMKAWDEVEGQFKPVRRKYV